MPDRTDRDRPDLLCNTCARPHKIVQNWVECSKLRTGFLYLHLVGNCVHRAAEPWQEAIRSQQPTLSLRPVVLWFARQMEQKLRENDHKGGWRDCDCEYLRNRMDEEIVELDMALDSKLFTEVIREAADVANFALMIADKCRADPLPEPGPDIQSDSLEQLDRVKAAIVAARAALEAK